MDHASLQGRSVTLPDGRTGRVMAEYWDWQSEDGVCHGHRLRVEITRQPCIECPHGPALVTSYTTVDAGEVVLI